MARWRHGRFYVCRQTVHHYPLLAHERRQQEHAQQAVQVPSTCFSYNHADGGGIWGNQGPGIHGNDVIMYALYLGVFRVGSRWRLGTWESILADG